MTTFRIDSILGRAEKTSTGTRIPVYTKAAGQQMEFLHGLGSVPRDVWITDKDAACDFFTVMKDKDRIVVTFTVGKVNLYLRCE